MGQKVTWQSVCTLTISAITINYNGQATVHWIEAERGEYNGVSRQEIVKYGDNEEYFNVSECISGGMGN